MACSKKRRSNLNPLTLGYYYYYYPPTSLPTYIYIWSDRRAFSAVKSRTGYSTRMFLASPAKQFLTTSACLPAGLPAIETFNGAHQWFHFVASSMNTYFNITYVARPNREGESTKVKSTCNNMMPPLSAAGFQRMITVSPFSSISNPGTK